MRKRRGSCGQKAGPAFARWELEGWDAHRIVEMYHHYLKSPLTVPIILMQLETSLDADETNAGVSNFLQDARLGPSQCRNAVVFVTRLDAVKAQVQGIRVDTRGKTKRVRQSGKRRLFSSFCRMKAS